VKNRLFPIAVSVFVLALSVAVCACGGEGSSAASTAGTVGTASDITQPDQALFEKMAALWHDNDVAAAKEIYAPDAVVYWVDSAASTRNTGIDDISAAVQRFSVSLVPVAGIHTYTLSSTELPQLGPSYGDAYYIAGPVAREGQVYMTVVEIRDGKIADQWVTPMYRY
jgi:hypothetical protein